jgi:hypothetical protein
MPLAFARLDKLARMQLRYLQLAIYLITILWLAIVKLLPLPLTVNAYTAASFGGYHILGIIIFFTSWFHAAVYFPNSWKGLVHSFCLPLSIYFTGEVSFSFLWDLGCFIAGVRNIVSWALGPGFTYFGAQIVFYMLFPLICFIFGRYYKYFHKVGALLVVAISYIYLIVLPMLILKGLHTGIADVVWHAIWLGGFMLASKYRS